MINIEDMNKDKLVNILINVGLVIMLALSLLYVFRVVTEAPYEFSQDVYQPTASQVCPGDKIGLNPVLRIKHTPVIATTYHTIWSVTDNRTAVTAERLFKDSDGAIGIRSQIWKEPTLLSRPFTFIVPKLNPGKYELIGAVGSNLRKTTTYSTPFTVREDCGE